MQCRSFLRAPLQRCRLLISDGNGFQNLEWLGRGCGNVFFLVIKESTVEDVSPLVNCESLFALVLDCPQLADLSPLLACDSLKHIVLIKSAVTDLEALMAKPDLVVEGNLSGVPPEQRAFFRGAGKAAGPEIERCASALIVLATSSRGSAIRFLTIEAL